jgi:transcriptional regulator with XRE-family HTH domain
MSILDEAAATLVAMRDEWSTLAGRVKWCVESGRVPSAKAWGIAAGVSGGYVGRVLNKNLKPAADKLEKLAAAANVPVRWLRFGEGAPDGAVTLELDHPYPTLLPVLAMAEKEGVAPSVLAALRAERCAGGDPGEEHWRRRLREQIREAKRLRKELDDDDTFGDKEGEE